MARQYVIKLGYNYWSDVCDRIRIYSPERNQAFRFLTRQSALRWLGDHSPDERIVKLVPKRRRHDILTTVDASAAPDARCEKLCSKCLTDIRAEVQKILRTLAELSGDPYI